MTDEPTDEKMPDGSMAKRCGRFLIPADWEDETPARAGKPIAIIGGISPTQVKPQQDVEQLERDDDKDKR
jgi:hypothetical protein